MSLARLRDGLLLLPDAGPDRREAAARAALAAMLDVPEAELQLARTPQGKPVLRAPVGASYSVSYRDGLMLLGACRGAEIGVDLEVVRDGLPLLDVADTFFGEEEAAFLRAQPGPLRPICFYALWTAKEAVLKATGRGIAGGLQEPRLDGKALRPFLAGAQDVALRPRPGTCVTLFARTVGGRLAVVAHATVRTGGSQGVSALRAGLHRAILGGPRRF